VFTPPARDTLEQIMEERTDGTLLLASDRNCSGPACGRLAHGRVRAAKDSGFRPQRQAVVADPVPAFEEDRGQAFELAPEIGLGGVERHFDRYGCSNATLGRPAVCGHLAVPAKTAPSRWVIPHPEPIDFGSRGIARARHSSSLLLRRHHPAARRCGPRVRLNRGAPRAPGAPSTRSSSGSPRPVRGTRRSPGPKRRPACARRP
jgi:hypothetical protein